MAVICQSQFAVQEHFQFLISRTEEVRPAKCKAIPCKLHDDTEKIDTAALARSALVAKDCAAKPVRSTPAMKRRNLMLKTCAAAADGIRDESFSGDRTFVTS